MGTEVKTKFNPYVLVVRQKDLLKNKSGCNLSTPGPKGGLYWRDQGGENATSATKGNRTGPLCVCHRNDLNLTITFVSIMGKLYLITYKMSIIRTAV